MLCDGFLLRFEGKNVFKQIAWGKSRYSSVISLDLSNLSVFVMNFKSTLTLLGTKNVNKSKIPGKKLASSHICSTLELKSFPGWGFKLEWGGVMDQKWEGCLAFVLIVDINIGVDVCKFVFI